MAVFLAETGTTWINATARIINGQITLQSQFAGGATCIVGMNTCSLATGAEAGTVTITRRDFIAPNTIAITAEFPGAGDVGGRDLYWAEFNYVVIGQAA